MSDLESLFASNVKWAEDIKRKEPNFFSKLAEQQAPEYLWIGCSDSRVPANEIVGLLPGELFVHRNVANLVLHSDIKCLSVLQYAIDILKIKHIIVCGHYGCGGVEAALGHQSFGLINKWLRNIKEVYKTYESEIDSIPDHKARVNRLVELNVLEQCQDLLKTSIIQKAWKDRQSPEIHGWVYGLDNGLVKELTTIKPDFDNIHPVFRYSDDQF